MAKDHIIPQVYMRWFSVGQSQDLYYFTKNPWGSKTARLGSPGRICHRDSYYYLNPNLSKKYGVDISHLDKTLLKYYEDNMPKHFDGLLNESPDVTKESAEFIAECIIVLKMRSDSFRGGIFNSQNVMGALSKVIDKLKQLNPGNEADIEKAMEEIKNKIKLPATLGELHSESLFKLLNGERDEMFKRIKDRILNSQWKIVSAENGSEFISSDNPGIFVTKMDEIVSTHFGGDGIFTLPLTPQKALQIDFSVNDAIALDNKKVGKDTMRKDIVMRTNQCTWSLCETTIYGASKGAVENAMVEM